MSCGLVHASYSLTEWQAVKLTFFAPWLLPVFTVYLIYGTWNKTWDILSASKCMGKGMAKWWCGLNSRKSYFAYTWTVIKSKDSLNLVISHASLNLDDILVKFWAAPESWKEKKNTLSCSFYVNIFINKISSFQVNTTSRRGLVRGYFWFYNVFFFYFTMKVAGGHIHSGQGKSPEPWWVTSQLQPLLQPIN